jgi:filamentous hemagglutinin
MKMKMRQGSRASTPPATGRRRFASGSTYLRGAIALVALFVAGEGAVAENILRRAGSATPSSPSAPDPNVQSATQAAVAARQAASPLRGALEAIKAFQASQDAARAAAQGGASALPNGLVPGGLELAPGVDPVNAKRPVEVVGQDGRHEITVEQNGTRAILTWSTFNVGKQTDLTFDQSAGGGDAKNWVALNRVLDTTAPSTILGTIKAQGQVYVLNRNGILFGGGSQVNVGGLLVSGLDIIPASPAAPGGRDDRFLKDTLYSLGFEVPAGETGPASVRVEAGARIVASGGGRLVLLGRTVDNAGSLEAKDGQVFLAAGDRIQLAPSSDQRGLASPVSGGVVVDPTASGDGQVRNSGMVSVPRGNITMVASKTVQDGLLSSTTGADIRGSISLGADGFVTELGPTSVTQILPDQSEDAKKVVGNGPTFRPSQVRILGSRIDLLDGAVVYVPSGSIEVSAVTTGLDRAKPDDTSIFVGTGARLDVSGLSEVEVAMEQNSIKAELRANELRNNPILRDGPLRGRTTYFDARNGGKFMDGSGIGDLSGYYDLVERDVSQLMTTGGTVTLAANQVVTRPGSTIDISGGSLKFLDGYVRSSVLIDQSGSRVPIEQAKAGNLYVGLDGDNVNAHPRWGISETYSSGFNRAQARFEKGYLQGGSAGTLTLKTNAPQWYTVAVQPGAGADAMPVNPSAVGAFRVLEGEVVATTVTGPRQRELPTGTTDPTLTWRQQPARGTLDVRNSGDVSFAGATPELGPAFGPGSAVDASLQYRLVLPTRWFDGSRFGKVKIASGFDSDKNVSDSNSPPGTLNRAPGGNLDIGAGTVVDLGDGGAFSFTGTSADIEGTLSAPGGTVSITARNLPQGETWEAIRQKLAGGQDLRPAIRLGPGGVIDVAGRFTNDALDGLTDPFRPLQGGQVSLASTKIVLEPGSRVDVSGGARLDATGTKLTRGNAGSIDLDVSRYPNPSGHEEVETRQAAEPFGDGTLSLGGVLDGHAAGKGGSLTIRTGKDVIVGPSLDPDAGAFDGGFFSRGGFASFTLVGERSLTVESGAIAPKVESLVPRDQLGQVRSGTHLTDVSSIAVLTDLSGNGQPISLTLQAGGDGLHTYASRLDVKAGAVLSMPAESSVTLAVLGAYADDLHFAGAIDAPGGSIALNASGGGRSVDPKGVVIDSAARLEAAGYARTYLDRTDAVRAVEPGGSISIAGRSVAMAPGAVVDVHGIQGVADLENTDQAVGRGSRFAPATVQGDAGTLSITAQSGLVAGDLRLAAGGDSGRGGTFVVSGQGQVVVAATVPQAPTGSAHLQLVGDAIASSGADDIEILAVQGIAFAGSVDLISRRSLVLRAPTLGQADASGSPSVHLSSRYVALVGAVVNVQPAVDAPGLAGELKVEADVIDVGRTLRLGCTSCNVPVAGFATTILDAGRGDIRFSDHDPTGRDGLAGQNPGLLSPGSLEFRAGQVYVASRARTDLAPGTLERAPGDPGFLVQSGEKIVVARGDGADGTPPTPLSFGERLTMRAPVIEQGGVLRAPAGQIRLEGTDLEGNPGVVTLLPGSVTSTSLGGAIVPFGRTLTGGDFFGYHVAGQAPTLSVKLDAGKVDVQAGALIDVSGGGDLLGYSFTPGNAGSTDVLDFRRDASGTVVARNGVPMGAPSLGVDRPAPFAIVPGLGAAPLPVGPTDELRDPRLKVGDQIWLHGVSGLADGVYTLLPAHYALLPGGLLVQPLGSGSFASAPASSSRPDGAQIVAGYRAVAGTPIRDAGYGQYVVMGAATFGKYSLLDRHSFEDSAQRLAADAGVSVRTPLDGGTVVLSAGEIGLDGTGRFDGAVDPVSGRAGLLGRLDVSASGQSIALLGPGGTAPEGYIALGADKLAAFGAGSVLLGGTRTSTPAGTRLDADAVEVFVDGGASWAGPEIVLAATSSVRVANGAVLHADGARAGTESLLLSGDGSLLRLSTAGRGSLQRTLPANLANPAAVLDVGDADLSATGSLGLDASRTVTVGAGVRLAAPQVDIASNRIHLGDASGVVDGTVLGKDLVQRLASSSDLLLQGYDSIHLWGALSLGGPGARLIFDTPLMQGHQGAGEVARIAAQELVLRNGNPTRSGGTAPSGGPGSMVLDVDQLTLGPGHTTLAGFDTVGGSRAGTLEVAGHGSLDFLGSSFAIATGQVQAGQGASYTVRAPSGAIELSQDSRAAAPPPATSLGGWLALDGSSIRIDTAVSLPAGTLLARARDGAVDVGPHATIDVSGRAVDFDGQIRFAPGGTIRLAAKGDVTVDARAILDASGSVQGGEAGTIDVAAGGSASLQGTLRGGAASGFAGGSFALDAGRLPDSASFSALGRSLDSGGFTNSREVRLRNAGQDIVVAASEAIAAHDVILRSDQGRVTVAGAVGLAGDATHDTGGRIELQGGAGVELTATAIVDARAAAADADGFVPASGTVVIASTGGTVNIAGARIDVSGGRGGGGSIVVRVPRTADGVAVDSLAGTFVGATEQVVQGVQSESAATVDTAWLASRLDQASAWLTRARAIHPDGLNGFELAPGIVATSGGDGAVQDLAIASELSLNGRLGPGYLGFVASGNIKVGAVISDGFTSAAREAPLLGSRSASFRFESGGDLVLAPAASIRTGTGTLSIDAGGDVRLQSGTAGRAVVYTAGRKANADRGWADGFANLGVTSAKLPGEFPVQGGGIDVRADGDVVGYITNQTSSAWMSRDGATRWNGDVSTSTVDQQASWSIVFRNFEQGIGALGGGDVRVTAGGAVRDLQVSIPTTGQLTTPLQATPREGDLVIRGGGDLAMVAGGDILGGQILLGRGHAEVRAGGSIAGSGSVQLRANPGSSILGPERRAVGILVGLGDATARLTAGTDAMVEAAFDPMMQGQIAEDLDAGAGAAFWGYTGRAGLSVNAVGGAVRYENDPWAAVDLSQANPAARYRVRTTGLGDRSLNDLFAWAPPTLRLTSLSGSAYLEDRFSGERRIILASAPKGNLEVLASGDVALKLNVEMRETDPRYAHGPLAAFATTRNPLTGEDAVGIPASTTDQDLTSNYERGTVPIHAGDPEPVRIYALHGSVCAQRSGSCRPETGSLLGDYWMMVTVPKPIEVVAGRDIVRGWWSPQNNAPDDVSFLVAGRDVFQPEVGVRGEGTLLLRAGRTVELDQSPSSGARFTTSGGNVLAYGNRSATKGVNAALPPDKGADVDILAGTANGVDYAAFADAYLDPQNGQKVVRTYVTELAGYMKSLDPSRYGSLSEAQLLAEFRRLPALRQEIFLDRIYFTELKETGIDYNDAASPRHQSYDRGFEAVKRLFPGDPSSLAASKRGNVILSGKTLTTWADGDLSVLAPYGRIDVGARLIPSFFDEGKQGGVVTRRGGDVRMMSDQNIDLYTSRVFTLEGGDILMWTSNGSITAGSGSKTSVRQVALQYRLTPEAVVEVDDEGLSTGAGIGVLDVLRGSDPGRKASRLDLIAPKGEVNAGDAGIRVLGDLNIAAAVVVGLENIQASGATQGVPKVTAPSFDSVSAASSVVQAASSQTTSMAENVNRSRVQDLPSIITVEVVGYETTRDDGPEGKKKR